MKRYIYWFYFQDNPKISWIITATSKEEAEKELERINMTLQGFEKKILIWEFYQDTLFIDTVFTRETEEINVNLPFNK